MKKMTIQKAIEWQQSFKKTYNGFPEEAELACNFAIQALLKRIAVQPTPLYIDNEYAIYKCPNCSGAFPRNGAIEYCVKCGQHIDWSDIINDDRQSN